MTNGAAMFGKELSKLKLIIAVILEDYIDCAII
jgi:hypothetical protein